MSVLDITQDGSTLGTEDGIDDITDSGVTSISDNTAILDIGNPEDPDAPVV